MGSGWRAFLKRKNQSASVGSAGLWQGRVLAGLAEAATQASRPGDLGQPAPSCSCILDFYFCKSFLVIFFSPSLALFPLLSKARWPRPLSPSNGQGQI